MADTKTNDFGTQTVNAVGNVTGNVVKAAGSAALQGFQHTARFMQPGIQKAVQDIPFTLLSLAVAGAAATIGLDAVDFFDGDAFGFAADGTEGIGKTAQDLINDLEGNEITAAVAGLSAFFGLSAVNSVAGNWQDKVASDRLAKSQGGISV